jgi:hypothetical protein
MEWLSLVGALLATAIALQSGARMADGWLATDADWANVASIALVGATMAALFLTARIHRSTWEAMASAPADLTVTGADVERDGPIR